MIFSAMRYSAFPPSLVNSNCTGLPITLRRSTKLFSRPRIVLLSKSSLPLFYLAAAAAKSLQPCPTLCDPIDGSPPGSPVPGILQARTLEWVAISFSNAWKWKVRVKSLICAGLLATPWTAASQAPPSMGFSRQKNTGVGCHCLLGKGKLEKEMATHSIVLAWRIPGTGEPGGLPSMGSHRVGHGWSDLAAAAAR